MAFLIVNNGATSATKFEKFKVNAQQMVVFVSGCLKKEGKKPCIEFLLYPENSQEILVT